MRILDSLKARILVLVFVAALPAIAGIVAAAMYERSRAVDAARAEILSAARHVLAEQREARAAAHQLLTALASLPEVRTGDPDACSKKLGRLLAREGALADLMRLSAQGTHVCAALPLPAGVTSVDASDRSYFKRAVATRAFAAGDYQLGRVTRRASINYALPFYGDDGALQGVLLASLRLADLLDRLANLDFPEGAIVTLLAPDFTVVDRSNDDDQVGKNITGTELHRAIVADGVEFVTLIRGLVTDRRTHAVMSARHPGGEVQGYIVISVPDEAIFASAQQALWREILLFALVFVTIAIIALAGAELLILRRVGALVGATRRLAGGDLKARAPLANGAAEFAELGSAFNDMAGRVERQIGEITSLNRVHALLSAVNSAIVQIRDENALSREACRIAVQTGGYLMATVALLEHSEPRFRLVANEGCAKEFFDRLGLDFLKTIEQADTPLARALRAGAPVIAKPEDMKDSTIKAEVLRHGTRAIVALPLTIRGAVAGGLVLWSTEPDGPDAAEQRLLLQLAGDIGLGLEHSQHEAQLALSEQRYRELFETNPHPMWVSEVGSRRFLAVNDAAVAHYGYSREEFLAMTLDDIHAPEDVPALVRRLESAAGRATVDALVRHRRKDGSRIEVEISANSIEFRGRPARVVLAHDVTARRRAERDRTEAEEKFRGLVEQSLIGIYIVDAERIHYANPRAAEIFGYGPDEISGGPVQEVIDERDRGLVRDTIRSGVEGEVESLRLEFRGRRKDGSSVNIGAHGRRARIAGEWRVIGVLQDITEKLRSEEQIRGYIERLERSMMATVQAISRMVELRDPYTSGHERRVGEIAAAIGAELGLDAEAQQGLRITGNVHDIGKITVPAEILAKPGKLTPIEFELVKNHSRQGYEILEPVDFPWPVAETILQHHERMDGSGYPGKLKGDEIRLEARILAVADTVEAMAGHRPYRPARGIESALEEIASGAGRRYDAEVAGACLRLFREKGFQLPK